MNRFSCLDFGDRHRFVALGLFVLVTLAVPGSLSNPDDNGGGPGTANFRQDFGFVNRLSRWLIDARCRTDSYARMPVSLDPIVRAEDALKPLFTPIQVLVNRLYRTAGLFRKDEL